MTINRWRDLEVLTPFPLPVADLGKSIGFQLVYENLDDLKSEHPDADFVEIQTARMEAHR